MDSTLFATIVLGAVGIGITAYYSRHTKRLAHDQMMKELFKDFNNRYSKLNDSLIEIGDKHSTPDQLDKAHNSRELKQAVLDYFNLCAEEFYWYYHKQRIDEVIWHSWQSGMLYWYSIPAIRDMWEKEVSEAGKASYYIIDKKEFFVRV